MGDRLSLLPDDILCVILSFLNLREAVKTRLISPRWKSLSSSLDILTLDEFNVFGSKDAKKRLGVLEYQTCFVKAVDQLLQSYERRSNNLKTLEIHFCFEEDFAFNIGRWVASFIRMKVETIDLDFHWTGSSYSRKSYFPCDIFLPDNTANLRHLSLFSSDHGHFSEFTTQLRFLNSIVLIGVPLCQTDLDSILSNCSDLVVLKLLCCEFPSTLCVHSNLKSLKVLVIHNNEVRSVKLHSATVETFEFSGGGTVFSLPYVPLLKRVYVDLTSNLKVDPFACIPHLEVFSLLLLTEVRHIRNHSLVFNSLKRLDLRLASGWNAFDPLISMDRLLHASPFLEILNLEVFSVFGRETRREYPRRSYPCLKEVHIKGCAGGSSQMHLVAYLLRAATNLKRMIISVTEPSFLYGDPKPKVHEFLRTESINFVAEVVVV